MPHLIDAQPVVDVTAKIASAIPDEAVRRRFQSLLASELFSDPDCSRPLTPEEAAPYGAQEPRDFNGIPFAVFDPPRMRLMLARRQAKVLREALMERDHLRVTAATLSGPQAPRAGMTLRFAEEWTRKFDRMSLDAMLEKAQFLVGERKARLRAERDEAQLFTPHEIAASPGRMWRRIVSVAELRRLGSDLHNCLAGVNGQRHGYVRRLREDVMRFWALYDETKIARAALMVETPTGRVCEARGYRNAPFPLEGADFNALAASGACVAPVRRTAGPSPNALEGQNTGLFWTGRPEAPPRPLDLSDFIHLRLMQPRRGARTRA